MSALEHIRKRPALVISVLGLALVLFIITAVSDNIFSFFGDRDTAAKVDGEKLKYDKWDKMRKSPVFLKNMQQTTDNSVIDEAALQRIINDELLNKELDKLGITVTDEEMQGYLFGPASIATPVAQSYGFETAEQFYSYAYSNDPDAASARALWEDMDNDLRKNVKAMKFQMMLGALTANKVDAEIYHNDNKNVTLNLAKVDFISMGNEDFKVTDAEINERYNKDKERYRIDTERRLVDYIIVTPTPSPEDITATSEEVTAAIEALRNSTGTEPISSRFQTSVVKGSLKSLPANVQNAIERIEQENTVALSAMGSNYNIAKFLSKTNGVEKANVDFYFSANSVIPGDSVLNALVKNDIARYGDTVQVMSKPDLNIFASVNLANYADRFINAAGQASKADDKEFKEAIIDEVFGSHNGVNVDDVEVCYKVNSVEDPTDLYEIAYITRELVPSETTINNLRKQLAEYSAKNANADAFKKNAANSNFHVEQGYVSPDHFAIMTKEGQRIPQTVSLVRWAFEDAKKGDVSSVIEADDSFIVIALDDIYSDGYAPATDPIVKEQLTEKIRADKKGAKLLADYKGKSNSVDGYAAAMNTQPITVRANYANNDGNIFRNDPKFLAAVGAAQEGKVNGPVATNSGIVVFEVVNVDNAGAEFDYKALAPQLSNMFQFDINNALRANKDIDYKALRFESKD